MTTNPGPITEAMVWEAANGAGFEYSWWERVEYIEGDWDKPGIIEVTIENPDGGKSISKRLTPADLMKEYREIETETHCGGCHLVLDPDACTTDLIFQQAMLGEILYA